MDISHNFEYESIHFFYDNKYMETRVLGFCDNKELLAALAILQSQNQKQSWHNFFSMILVTQQFDPFLFIHGKSPINQLIHQYVAPIDRQIMYFDSQITTSSFACSHMIPSLLDPSYNHLLWCAPHSTTITHSENKNNSHIHTYVQRITSNDYHIF